MADSDLARVAAWQQQINEWLLGGEPVDFSALLGVGSRDHSALEDCIVALGLALRSCEKFGNFEAGYFRNEHNQSTLKSIIHFVSSEKAGVHEYLFVAANRLFQISGGTSSHNKVDLDESFVRIFENQNNGFVVAATKEGLAEISPALAKLAVPLGNAGLIDCENLPADRYAALLRDYLSQPWAIVRGTALEELTEQSNLVPLVVEGMSAYSDESKAAANVLEQMLWVGLKNTLRLIYLNESADRRVDVLIRDAGPNRVIASVPVSQALIEASLANDLSVNLDDVLATGIRREQVFATAGPFFGALSFHVPRIHWLRSAQNGQKPPHIINLTIPGLTNHETLAVNELASWLVPTRVDCQINLNGKPTAPNRPGPQNPMGGPNRNKPGGGVGR